MIEHDKVKLTAIIIGTTVFFAYIKQYLFYKYFNIDISEFISINEVFTPFIDDLAILSIFILGLTIVMLIIIGGLITYLNSRVENKVSESSETKKLSLMGKILDYKYFFAIVNNLALIFIAYKLHTVSENYIVWFVFLPLIIVSIIQQIIGKENHKIKEFKNENPTAFHTYKNLLPLFIIFLVSTAFFSMITFYDVGYKTKKEFKTTKYVFNFKNQYYPIKTDSLNIYLGRTYNNFFIYNLNDKKTTIYNTAEIQTQEVINLEK